MAATAMAASTVAVFTLHLKPEVQPGAYFVVRSQCVLHGDLEHGNEDIAHAINQ